MRGPKPQPTKLKILRGVPGKRRLPENEPTPPVELPEPPEIIQGHALAEWHRITPLLHAAGLLTVIDGSALVAYCQSYATWLEAQQNIRKSGTVIKSIQGQPMMSPYLKVANVAWQQWTRMLVEFGMTPSSRSRVTVASAPPEDDEFERFLRKHKHAGGKGR